MKILFTTDLCVDRGHYARLTEAARATQPDLIILGGNALPKDMAITPQAMGIEQPNFVRTEFPDILQRVRSAAGGAPICLVHGNLDWGSTATAMQEIAAQGHVTVLSHTEPHRANGLTLLGYGCTPPTDGFVKDFERLDRAADRPPLLGGGRWDPRFKRVATHGAAVMFAKFGSMEADLAKLSTPAEPWVFVAYAPPNGTALDRSHTGESRGSHAIRAVIERHRPFLSLHGHLTDHLKGGGRVQDQIGSTVAVNVGQSAAVLHYGLIEVDPAAGKVISVVAGQQR